MTDEVQETVDEAQVEAPVDAATTDSVSESGEAPWSKDLEGLGLGEYTPVVDQYLREKVQPRVTQLEQRAKAFESYFDGEESARIAAQVMTGLSNPETYQETLRTLDDVLEWGLFNEEGVPVSDDAVEVEDNVDGGQAESEAPVLDPKYQEFLDQQIAEREAEERRQVVDQYLDGKAEQYGDEFDRGLYEMVFSQGAARGESYEAIDKAYEQWAEKLHPAEPAPTVLTDATGQAVPAGAQPVGSFEEATQRVLQMMENNR